MEMERAKKPCKKPRCANLVTSGAYCDLHRKIEAGAKEELRQNAYQRGYSKAWRKARAGYLAKHPVCVECEREGRVVGATVVDHIIDHKGDKDLFWDSDNWQPLCKLHHDRKTALTNPFRRYS
jgi:5-methylcytosine-specific restriction protein A